MEHYELSYLHETTANAVIVAAFLDSLASAGRLLPSVVALLFSTKLLSDDTPIASTVRPPRRCFFFLAPNGVPCGGDAA